MRLDGDGADVESYFIAAAKAAGGTELELVGGRYCDRFEKRSGEWRIQTRLVLLDWQSLTDASGMAERLTRGHRGSRDREDPSYESPVRQRHALPTGP